MSKKINKIVYVIQVESKDVEGEMFLKELEWKNETEGLKTTLTSELIEAKMFEKKKAYEVSKILNMSTAKTTVLAAEAEFEV